MILSGPRGTLARMFLLVLHDGADGCRSWPPVEAFEVGHSCRIFYIIIPLTSHSHYDIFLSSKLMSHHDGSSVQLGCPFPSCQQNVKIENC